jgi:hypothetical protein
MRTNIAILAAPAALASVGCSSAGAHHPAHSSSTKTVASSNERSFVNWLARASTDPAQISSTISGPAMLAYAQIEAMNAVAADPRGHPISPETVSLILGGYQGCGTDNGTTFCGSFTDWVTNASGRITDLNIDGQLVSQKIAICSPNGGGQLAFSDVVAYLPTQSGYVQLDYQARNASGHVFGNCKPAWLNVFDPTGGGALQEDRAASNLSGDLQSGKSAVEAVVFATQTPTGSFTLCANDKRQSVIASCTLRTA